MISVPRQLQRHAASELQLVFLQQGPDPSVLMLQALKASECIGSYSGILRKSSEVDTMTPLYRQGVGGFILDKYKDLELTGRLVPPFSSFDLDRMQYGDCACHWGQQLPGTCLQGPLLHPCSTLGVLENLGQTFC